MSETCSTCIRAATLFDAIQHGDDDHRDWLREAIACHFSGKPVPPARGKGSSPHPEHSPKGDEK